MPVNYNKVHDYLGMNLDNNTKGCVNIYMIKYVHKVLEAFPEKITSTLAPSAVHYLFEIKEEGEANLLPKAQERHFHIQWLGYYSCV